jgi:hypothetical protein
VLTSIAAEGFAGFRSGIIANEPEEFASAVLELLTNRDSWIRCAANAVNDIAAQMSPVAVRGLLESRLYPALGLNPVIYGAATPFATPNRVSG